MADEPPRRRRAQHELGADHEHQHRAHALQAAAHDRTQAGRPSPKTSSTGKVPAP
jgi:hypothetical protein